MGFFQWWGELSPWIRYSIAGFFLLLSTLIWFSGYFWPYGWAAGVILLLFGGPSDSEKKGYRF